MFSNSCKVCDSKDWQALFKQKEFALNRCKNCGVVTADVAEDKKVIYTEDYYWNMKEIDPISKLRYESIVGRIKQYRKNGRLLDVGCGVGHFLSIAKRKDWQVTGVEISEGARKIAKDVFELDISLGELPTLNLGSESFDVVTMLECIEHLEEPTLYLKEIHRLLRKGGLLMLTTVNINSLSKFLLGFKWRVFSPEHYHLFTVSMLKRFLSKNGFQIKDAQTKNISINEIIGKIFIKKNFVEVDAYHRDKKLRKKLESSKWLFLTKAIVNKILNVTRLGDSVWIYAEKK